MVVSAHAPTRSGRVLLCGQQTKNGVSAHQRYQLTCAKYVNRPFQGSLTKMDGKELRDEIKTQSPTIKRTLYMQG
jgi:hypothetical protein